MVAATRLIETCPGVLMPSRSSGSRFGSVTQTLALIVPSLAIDALATLKTSPGRTKLIMFASAKKALSRLLNVYFPSLCKPTAPANTVSIKKIRIQLPEDMRPIRALLLHRPTGCSSGSTDQTKCNQQLEPDMPTA